MIGEMPTPNEGDRFLPVVPEVELPDTTGIAPKQDHLIETGDNAQAAFVSVPEAEPPEAHEQIFYDNIFEPRMDLEDERDRMQTFRRTIGERLGLLQVDENAIEAVKLGATELITNAKRYAWGGDIFASFTQTGDILVEVRGADAHPPELPAAAQEPAIEDEFSESLDLSAFGIEIDLDAINAEMATEFEEDETALNGLQAIRFDGNHEHGRGLNIVRAQSQKMGRYRLGEEEIPVEDKPWSMWFTVSSGQNDYTVQP